MDNDRRYETIGKAICKITYWIYAFKFILGVSLAAAVVLFIFNLPLWLAPLIGIAVFLIYRFIRRLIFRIIFKLIR